MAEMLKVRFEGDEGTSIRPADEWDPADGEVVDEPITVEELADYCETRAESANMHEFVGLHRYLACLIAREAGRAVAGRVIRYLAERGGLGRMAEGGPAWPTQEFGVMPPWSDWVLPDA